MLVELSAEGTTDYGHNGVAPVEWTPDLLREKGVHSAKNETTVRAGVPASNS